MQGPIVQTQSHEENSQEAPISDIRSSILESKNFLIAIDGIHVKTYLENTVTTAVSHKFRGVTEAQGDMEVQLQPRRVQL